MSGADPNHEQSRAISGTPGPCSQILGPGLPVGNGTSARAWLHQPVGRHQPCALLGPKSTHQWASIARGPLRFHSQPGDPAPPTSGWQPHTRQAWQANGPGPTRPTKPPPVVNLPLQEDPRRPHQGTAGAWSSADKMEEHCWDAQRVTYRRPRLQGRDA